MNIAKNFPWRFPKDRELLNLLVSGVAVVMGLLWMFFGKHIIFTLVPEENQSVFYYFISGVIFSLTFVGLYGFIRTVLCFTEFMLEPENLTSLMYDNLLNDEHEGLFLKNKQGIYKLISPIAVMVLNLENKQVLGANDSQLHTLSMANKIMNEDQRVIDFGETIVWETTKNTGHGEESYLCKKFPCLDRRENIVGIIGSCKNITVLKTFQNLNLQMEERYRILFNKLPYPVLVLDSVSMQPFTFNDAMNNLLGYQKEEFSRMRMSLHIEADDLANFQQSMTDIINTGGGEFETSLVTRQRDTVNVTGYAQEIIIDDKAYLHMLLYDNTELKKSTDILINSELKYRSLFEHANDAIVVVSPNTLNIIDANEIAISFLGYSRDDLLLMSIQDLDASIDHTFTQGKIADLEIYNHALYEQKIENRKGERLEVEINAHKLNYGDDNVYQFVIRNIGVRKKTEQALKASESRYRQMFESNMAIKLVIDPDNFRIEYANPAAANFYGYSIEELKGMDLAQINILSRDKLNSLILKTREQSLGFYSCPHRLSNGEIRFVEVRDGPMEIEGRQLFYSIIHDVTASKEAENQVLVASKMFDFSTDAVMLINDNNQVVSVNYAFTQITGFQQSEIQSSPPEVILANKNEPLLSEEVLKVIDETGQWKGEIWHRLKNGNSKSLSVSINSIRNQNTNASSFVVLLSPKYRQISGQDNKIHYVELTQLANKSLFIDRLNNAIERAQRNRNKLGIILIDFTSFSDVNSQYGYDIGDRLLKAISKRLKYNTRNSDTVSHFSSDDFAVLLEDLNEIQKIGIVAQKLLSTLSEDYMTENHVIDLNVSMGISIYPEDGTTSDQLIARAQAALLTAQLKPGNHFELTNATMNQQASLSIRNEADLHQALRQDEFYLEFHPQVNIQTNAIESVEALIRWNHPQQGTLNPLQFLPGADQSGFIGAIGFNVIDKAFIQFQDWLNQGISIPRINLNISLNQIDTDLIDILFERCEKYDIPHNCIGLEFSEHSFITISPEQQQLLLRLQKNDFFICIDDFGSNNISLSCLLQCPVNAIKIDHSLVRMAIQSEEADNLLKGLVSFCNTLEIQVVGECIETDNEFEYLKTLGIKHMQGYLFCQPLLADDVIDFASVQHTKFNS